MGLDGLNWKHTSLAMINDRSELAISIAQSEKRLEWATLFRSETVEQFIGGRQDL